MHFLCFSLQKLFDMIRISCGPQCNACSANPAAIDAPTDLERVRLKLGREGSSGESLLGLREEGRPLKVANFRFGRFKPSHLYSIELFRESGCNRSVCQSKLLPDQGLICSLVTQGMICRCQPFEELFNTSLSLRPS